MTDAGPARDDDDRGGTMTRIGRTVAAAIGIGAALAAGSVPAGAATTISGQITCAGSPPQGVWVTADSGGSGWASWSRLAGTNTIRYTRTLPYGGSWYLAVGCGGTPQRWGVTTYSGTYSGGGAFHFTCHDVRAAWGAYGRCQRT